MATYWIDPHTTTNGTGTFASPWSLGMSTRTTFQNNDEVRLKGVALTDLLTATEYTATYTSYYQLTITAGGSLGADFSQFDIVYLPQADTFFRITSVSGNIISIVSSRMLPWYNTSTGQDNIIVRKVDRSTYGNGATSTVGYILNTNIVNDITISDCWIDETTRVTDGSVKTIFYSSTTSTSMSFFLNGNISTRSTSTGVVFNLQNTHLLPTQSTGGNMTVTIRGSNTTYNLGQISSNGTSGNLTIGTTTSPIDNCILNITHSNGYMLSGGLWYGTNLTLNITNTSLYYALDYSFGSSYNSLSNMSGATITFGDIINHSYVNHPSLFAQRGTQEELITVNYNGTVDVYPNTILPCFIVGTGNIEINFGAGFSYLRNRRTTTQTSVTRAIGNMSVSGWFFGNRLMWPNIPTPPIGWTVTNNDIDQGTMVAASSLFNSGERKRPFVVYIETPITFTSTSPAAVTEDVNFLCYSRDGDMLKEVLGIGGTGFRAGTSATSFPAVTRDATTFRTTGPSLRSLLTTRNASYWFVSPNGATIPTVIKNILIPVVDGTTYTVTGYIRTGQAGYVNGDCSVSVYLQGIELDSQIITTACINSWEQFQLTFTPSKTGEAYFVWEMYYSAGNSSYWLDDLEITSA
jgi:hypothetical protein